MAQSETALRAQSPHVTSYTCFLCLTVTVKCRLVNEYMYPLLKILLCTNEYASTKQHMCSSFTNKLNYICSTSLPTKYTKHMHTSLPTNYTTFLITSLPTNYTKYMYSSLPIKYSTTYMHTSLPINYLH